MTSNPFLEYINDVEKNPDQYPKKIRQQVKIQREMLDKFDFLEEKGRKACEWIEDKCYLTEGENAGQQVKLMLWQKWII